MAVTQALRDELLAAVDEERLVARLSEMVTIRSENPFEAPASPGYQEQEYADYLAQAMSELGLEVVKRDVVPGRPNVWGRFRERNDGTTLMLAGHTDTVGTEGYDEPFDGRLEDGKIYGRGSCDMKAGLAAYLEAVRVLKEAKVPLTGDLIVAGICDEEFQMIGSRDMGKNGPWADFGIIGEPTDLTICPAHKGQFSLFIRTFGKAVHSSVPELGENAIERMARVVLAFSNYNDELKQATPHALCGHGRFSPGVIRGGGIVSSVPDYCELEVDRRTLPGESSEEVVAQYRRRLDRLAAEDPRFRYEISDPSWDVKSLDTPISSPVVQSLSAAYEVVLGEVPDIHAFPAATDAPNLGFPTVVCGPGSLAQAHTTCEYVEVSQLVAAARLYLASALDMVC
ncbi:MAG: M20 family metallopeptidase [Pseudomonadota bacterium]